MTQLIFMATFNILHLIGSMKRSFFLFIFLITASSGFSSSYYGVGGSGNWSDFAVHWATASGGNVFQAQVPSSSDDVFFDANSFPAVNDTVRIDQAIAYCKNMDWGSASNIPAFVCTANAQLKIYGSLVFCAAMKNSFNGTLSFESASAGNTITTNGDSLLCYVVFNGGG